MNLDDFDYELPEDRIAQVPAARRDDARLLVLGRRSGAVRHAAFADLGAELRPGDLLVLNDTQVIPARLPGAKDTGGRVAMLLVERVGGDETEPMWRCLLDVSRPPRPGSILELPAGLRGEVVEKEAESWIVRLTHPTGDPFGVVLESGHLPLPPYIRREPDDARTALDRERYQTVFARIPGAVAAPTAGLHFSLAHIDALASGGIGLAYLTLHVGLGTFLPVRAARVEEHRMHAEPFAIPQATAEAVEKTRRAGGRVVAVGTTVVRTLESCATEGGYVLPGSGRSDLFIYPGFRFRVVDALVTNFHLPKTTLLLLVAAFAGRERVLAAYEEAVRERYRFFSYGDAMLVIDP